MSWTRRALPRFASLSAEARAAWISGKKQIELADKEVLPTDDAAYAWINFVMQPEIAAKITDAVGNFTASAGSDAYVNDALKAKFQVTFPPEAVDNIKWYPPVPAGLEALEGATLDRVNAAQ